MLYAWIDGVKRPPLAKGERTACRDCGGLLSAVLPVENVRHWRHKAGDCDPWSEPEGPWHLGWKERFDLGCREVGLRDGQTGERHRADVLCGAGTPAATILELQHSSISEDERAAREAFYRREHRMFWLVHVYSTDTAFTGHSFGFSLDFRTPRPVDNNTFYVLRWMGRSKQFIEKWKRATAHVFFDFQGHIFFLAGEALGQRDQRRPSLGQGRVRALPADPRSIRPLGPGPGLRTTFNAPPRLAREIFSEASPGGIDARRADEFLGRPQFRGEMRSNDGRGALLRSPSDSDCRVCWT